MDSVLISVKKMLGITEEYTHFDADIIMHINSVFMILNQLGVGPTDCFRIEDATATWSDFLTESSDLDLVKSYMSAKVRLLFDPPTSSIVMECMKNLISEMEWRLNVEAENNDKEEDD